MYMTSVRKKFAIIGTGFWANYQIPAWMELEKNDTIQLLAGQKRELFIWYGWYSAQFLYDMVHKTNKLSSNDRKAGITNIPFTINTGLLKITKENVDQFIKH